MNLQGKLVLAALAAVTLPVLGWFQLRSADLILRDAQEQTLLATARVLARGVDDRLRLPGEAAWHVQRSTQPLVVDGYADDWNHLAAWPETAADGSSLWLAEHSGDLYLLLGTGETASESAPGADLAGQLDLWLGLHGARCRYHLDLAAPGGVETPPLEADPRCFTPLRAQWQSESGKGRLELRLPASAALGYLGVRWHPAGDAGADDGARLDLRPVQRFSRDLSLRLGRVLPAGMRVRLLDGDGWALADASRPERPDPDRSWLTAGAHEFLLPTPGGGSASLDGAAPRLLAAEVWQALSGLDAISRRSGVTRGGELLAVAVPLAGRVDPAGALLLEQHMREMPLAARPLLFWTLLAIFVFLLLAGVLLAGFALHLAWRLRRMRHAFAGKPEQRDEGKPGPLQAGLRPDELDQLAAAQQSMRGTLDTYGDALRLVAARLATEMGGPLGRVQASLYALEEMGLSGAHAALLRRAIEGSEQLVGLARGMGAAARMQRRLEQGPGEDFDLRLLVAGCAEGYRLLAGARDFSVLLPPEPVRLHGLPDAVAEALDKLFDNALAFTPEDGWIRLLLTEGAGGAVLTLANQGPPLPTGGQAPIFEALVSSREGALDDAPHPGLGLHVVRLVAEQHGGSVEAENIDGGVMFHLRLRGLERPAAAPAEDATAQDDDPAANGVG